MKNHTTQDSIKESMAKDEYLVAAKVLLYKDGKFLVTHDKHGDWDIPGGRIRRDQFHTDLEDVLKEKMKIELGENFSYKIGDIVTTLRLKRNELGRNNEEVRIFAVVFRAELTGGTIEPGPYHDKIDWIDPKVADFDEYASPASWVTLLKDYFKRQP